MLALPISILISVSVIEKYTKSTRFALICNHVNKIIPALQSRCTRFRFAPLNATHVKERLQHVIKAEGYVSHFNLLFFLFINAKQGIRALFGAFTVKCYWSLDDLRWVPHWC